VNPEDLAREKWRPVAKAVEKRDRLGRELSETNEHLVRLRNELPQSEQADPRGLRGGNRGRQA
jgi:hypothetical protein